MTAMKKAFVLFLVSAIVLSSCSFASNKGTTVRVGIEYTSDAVDKESLDSYFLSNETLYPYYKALKEKQPTLLDNVKAINPGDRFTGGISMVRFSSDVNVFMSGETLLFDDEYHLLGDSFGGYGVTEFVRRQGDAGHWLYYIYSYGSGIHRTEIRAYSLFKDEEYAIKGLELETNKDYTFAVDESDNTIDLYEATIHASYDEDGYETYSIAKGQLAYENIDDMEKA